MHCIRCCNEYIYWVNFSGTKFVPPPIPLMYAISQLALDGSTTGTELSPTQHSHGVCSINCLHATFCAHSLPVSLWCATAAGAESCRASMCEIARNGCTTRCQKADDCRKTIVMKWVHARDTVVSAARGYQPVNVFSIRPLQVCLVLLQPCRLQPATDTTKYIYLQMRGTFPAGVLLPRCMQCRRGLAMRFLSVRPSVKRVHWDKTEERYV